MKVIIVGAGASGLMAACELSRKGVEVILLEAENRIGGRIHTLTPPGFVHQIEAGAEFIHGNLPLTLRLMKKAGLSFVKADGKMYRAKNGKIDQHFGQGKSWEMFYEKLQIQRRDMTLDAFLEKHFSGVAFSEFRSEIYDMAQGLDLADASKLSVTGIKKEWLSDETQYRTMSGYQRLLEFLYDDATANGLRVYRNEKVAAINWKNRSVKVKTADATYEANAVLLTIPLPHFQNQKMQFVPGIPEMLVHFNSIGFGEVIKFSMEFKDAFWEEKYPGMGFLFTENGFTFWTQLSQHKPYLTGWIGNGYVGGFKNASDEKLLQSALEKLQESFGGIDIIGKYTAGAVFRFTKESASGGGYSWLMPESKNAIREINKGTNDTIWFAGEALHPGGAPGTVEAALQSGKFAAKKILKTINSRPY